MNSDSRLLFLNGWSVISRRWFLFAFIRRVLCSSVL